ncbi:MAG: GTP-binding protein [Candidatus Thorarchaeota archaeon]|nr:MAG: GTP-binding protein [Candidatus Thorarchaeota archaeon]
MIREINIFKDGQTLFEDVIVPNRDLDTSSVMMLVSSSAKKLQEWKIDSMEVERYRYVYMNSHDTQFIMTMDRQASLQKVSEAMMTMVSKFMTAFESVLENDEWKSTDFSPFGPGFRAIVSRIPVKVCLAGHGGTGKTTLLELATLPSKGPPQEYVPTFFGDKALLKADFDPYIFSMFDLGGQDRFVQEWSKIIRSGSMVVLVTDSTQENIDWTKRVAYPVLKAELPYARAIVIANKQDLPGALSPEEVGKRMGVHGYGMQANQADFRQRWLKLLKDLAFEEIPSTVVGEIIE